MPPVVNLFRGELFAHIRAMHHLLGRLHAEVVHYDPPGKGHQVAYTRMRCLLDDLHAHTERVALRLELSRKLGGE